MLNQSNSVTIEIARLILKNKENNMTDQQILRILNFLYPLCQKTIESVIKVKINEKLYGN